MVLKDPKTRRLLLTLENYNQTARIANDYALSLCMSPDLFLAGSFHGFFYGLEMNLPDLASLAET
jgi:hypothetical protein